MIGAIIPVSPDDNGLIILRANSLQRNELAHILGSGGFEPSKAEPTDLQSAPFDRSGNSPFKMALYIYIKEKEF